LGTVPDDGFAKLLTGDELMPNREIVVPGLYETAGYTNAVMAGDVLFTSGLISRNAEGETVGEGDFEAQAHQVYKNLSILLEAAGASWDAVVKYNAYVARPEDYERSRSIHHEYLPAAQSAGSTIVTPLMLPELLYELEVIAYVGRPKQCMPGAVTVDNTIYLDAQEGESGTLDTQIESMYQRFGKVLDTNGAHWGDLVWSYGYVTRNDVISPLRDIRYRYMRAGEVAQTSFVCGLGTPGTLIRSELIATTAERRAFTVPGVSVSTGVAHAVQAGNVIYVQGQLARDVAGQPVAPGDMEAQAESVFRSLDLILAATGAGWRDVVRIKNIMTDATKVSAVRRVRDKYLSGMSYTSASVVGSFFVPEFMLEIEAIAVIA
jgi:enamine deaminase RidA (YjgF/YER057c/UK114 family)